MSFKHLVAAAAFVATSAVQAASAHDWTVTSGSATVTISANSRSILSAASANLVISQPVIPNISGLSNPGSPNGAVVVRNTGRINLALTGGSATDGGVSSLYSGNSLVQIKRVTQDIDDNVLQYSVFITDWDFDLNASTVYAKLYALDAGATTVQDLGRLALFKASIGNETQVVQNTVDAQGNITAHVQGAFTGALRIDLAAADLILNGLHLPTTPNEQIVQLFKDPTLDWGSVSYSANLQATPAVPEPESYVLIGAGLMTLCFMHRKRT